MKKIKPFLLITLLILITVFNTSGCVNNTSIPIQSKIWRNVDSDYLQFYTNDPKDYGWTFWCWNDTVQSPMDYVETSLKKVSGSYSMGYGIIFCHQGDRNFYYIIITTNGYYRILKMVNSEVIPITDWPLNPTPNLTIGFNEFNTIKVKRDSENTFSVYFNNKFERSFTDNSFSGGDSGYIVAIGDHSYGENFPNIPVDIRFKQLYPALTASIKSNHHETMSGSKVEIFHHEEFKK